MRSTFSGFGTAQSGLFAAQRQLDITSHNLSNINTQGYSRQRSIQTAARPMHLGGQGYLGMGVDMKAVSQIRDQFLDIRYRADSQTLGFWEERHVSFEHIETIYQEPKEGAILDRLNGFFTSLEMLSTGDAVSSATARAVVLQDGIGLGKFFQDLHHKMENMVKDLDQDVVASVQDINALASEIASLNQTIYDTEYLGGPANDLRDQRNLLIDDLSRFVKIQTANVAEPSDRFEKLALLIDGMPLVSHTSVNLLTVKAKPEAHPLTADTSIGADYLSEVKVHNLQWATGALVNQQTLGGKLGGQLQQRDGYTREDNGVPYYIRTLNSFVQRFAEKFNEIHKEGVPLGNPAGAKPLDFFTNGGGSSKISARNLTIHEELLKDPSLLAAGAAGGQGAVDDRGNLLKMIAFQKDQAFEVKENATANTGNTLFKGTPSDVLRSIIGTLGVEAREAKKMSQNQKLITEEVDRYRMSVSGVSENEEISNMMKYQHAYNASARMITTLDEMLDVIVNRMGRVGL